MLRIGPVTAIVAIAAAVALVAPGVGAKRTKPSPAVIQLPTGFQPEGIEVGKGPSVYVGSLANGAIWRGNLQTGKGTVFIPGAAGRSAGGIEFDRRKQRLFVAGGATGKAYVFNTRKRTLLRTYNLTTGSSFINDVVLTRNAAYFTDSSNPTLYKIPISGGGRLGNAQAIQVGGDYTHVPNAFNLNGIVATPDGKTLIGVQTANGRLYRINPATGAATTIQLANGESVPNGDGLLLDGRRLYVVQNQDNAVAVTALSRDLGSGTVLTRVTNPNFAIPTTLDEFGGRLYTVNARFGTDSPDSAAYQVIRFRKPA